MTEESVFKNEDALLPDYLPEILPHREDKIKRLADNLLPASKGRKPQNTFLFGSPGVGKTAVAKFVFREFEEYSGIKTFYINCWDYKTAHSILSKIVIDLGVFVQRRGIGKDEILEKLIECCRKNKKGLVVCLDEVDQLIFNDEEALYDLLRINQYVDNPIGLVFVSNNPYIFANIDPRIKSSLSIEELEFNSYSLEELKDILQQRARLSFFSIEDGVILLAANHALQNGGDVRVGLECLLKAGKTAEKRNSKKLKVEHIKEILITVKPAKPQILKERVNEDEKMILDILNEKNKIFSGELYDEYSKRAQIPVSERAFRDFVNHLAEIGLIKAHERKRGIKGKTRVISRI
ncbi:MAG TPA: AAA family ATPase [archaeon]|nr:AAA family ATPase [archaeon]